MGSGFVPSGIYGYQLGDMGRVLADCPAFRTLIGAADATAALAAQYFFDIDEREAQELTFPFARWEWGDDFRRRALGGAGCGFKTEGSVVLWIVASTPVGHVGDTAAAKNWILNVVQGILLEMEGILQQSGRPVIGHHRVLERPFREGESGNDDFVGMAVAFELRQ